MTRETVKNVKPIGQGGSRILALFRTANNCDPSRSWSVVNRCNRPGSFVCTPSSHARRCPHLPLPRSQHQATLIHGSGRPRMSLPGLDRHADVPCSFNKTIIKSRPSPFLFGRRSVGLNDGRRRPPLSSIFARCKTVRIRPTPSQCGGSSAHHWSLWHARDRPPKPQCLFVSNRLNVEILPPSHFRTQEDQRHRTGGDSELPRRLQACRRKNSKRQSNKARRNSLTPVKCWPSAGAHRRCDQYRRPTGVVGVRQETCFLTKSPCYLVVEDETPLDSIVWHLATWGSLTSPWLSGSRS